jgi:hypothetical protein
MIGAMAATDYEKLGVFYLGKEYDLAAGTRRPELVLYDSKDLVTHAVCVGMTGSGKTGLGIGLIEEAALDGVPVLAIDPKGDLANLLLTFPDLAPADFAPWADPSDAARRSLTPEAFAAQQAELWTKGLAEWDEDGARIARLRAAADFRLYTPGSRAGVPLALLNSLSGPPDENPDDARTRITTTASSLLALAGLTDMAPHSREQALIAAILAAAPRGRGSSDAPQGTASTADLPWLVGAIQKPPFDKIGVLDLETFYPARERQDLALRFNSVLATPGFEVWLDGDPLDVGAMLHTPEGRPRVAIVSIAHLGDTERMLVVSLLLSALLDWTRKQGGTSSLRAMLYMDEVFGYLPPVATPPSKAPLLTLLKQARAFGVGIVLATQNPVDLDYKALSNTGTWFLGKLQTERDKARVLDGLEGVTSGLDRRELDATLSGLKSRVFLMHNVHETAPVVFETRWTLSYLRGPMGREELKRASGSGASVAKATTANTNGASSQGPGPGVRGPASSAAAAPVRSRGSSDPPARDASTASRSPKPLLPANIPEYFLTADEAPAWRGVLYGSARIHYTDSKLGIDTVQDLHVTAPFTDGAVPLDWQNAEPADERPEDLVKQGPAADASFAPLPPAALDPKKYTTWTKDFGQWVIRAERLTLFAAPSVKLTSRAGESERDFRLRLSQSAREARDAAVEKLRASYAGKMARLTQRVATAEEGMRREEDQASQQRTQTMVSFGATVIGALLGRKAVSASTLGRATTAVRGVGRAAKEAQDVGRAKEKLAMAQAELKALEDELSEEIAAMGAVDTSAVTVDTIEVKPKRGGVDVRLVALVWKPES